MMAAADHCTPADSAARPRSDKRLNVHVSCGTSNKRPRQESEEDEAENSPPFRPQSGPVDEDDKDEGCCCNNADCLWRWGSSSSSLEMPPRSSAAPTTVSEPSFFHGPLLSVKEYRDRRTGEVRWV